MSFLKRLKEKRLWIGILLTMAVAMAINMLGAVVFCRGWLSPSYERMWAILSWLLGTFFGCRYVLADGRKKAIPWAGATAGIVYAIIWIVSLIVSRDVNDVKNWWQILTALAVGAMLSALMRPGLKRRKKKKASRRTRVKRR